MNTAPMFGIAAFGLVVGVLAGAALANAPSFNRPPPMIDPALRHFPEPFVNPEAEGARIRTKLRQYRPDELERRVLESDGGVIPGSGCGNLIVLPGARLPNATLINAPENPCSSGRTHSE